MESTTNWGKMAFTCYLPILLLFILQTSQAQLKIENGLKTDVFLSPKFELEPGSVSNKYYYGIDFPRGHIAIKSFNAEVVDEGGNSIPLHETYLHHWVVLRYYQRKDSLGISKHSGDSGFLQSDHVIIKNSGMCSYGLTQYFGLGSETRRTKTDIPDPYGIEVGNPEDIPGDGYEELWLMNIHAIDTRAAVDKMGCTECRCDLYNMTGVVPDSYKGGLRCCHDNARCRVKDGFEGLKKSLYLRYSVQYLDWDASMVPVEIYILDVTDIFKGLNARHHCLIEYDVESCPAEMANDSGCTHKKSLTISLPTGGDVIYGVGHQHSGGIGTTLYGEGGRVICDSNPTYGKGNEPGNETGYIVGMSTCYPTPGSIKVSAGEMLTLVSKYNSTKEHTGVMGLFYILVANPIANSNIVLHAATEAHKSVKPLNIVWAIALFGAALIAVVIIVLKSNRSGRGQSYEAMIA